MYFWPRHSSSYVFDLYDNQKQLTLHERVKINSCTTSGAALAGYVYQVWDTLGTPLGWWPCDTSFSTLFTANGGPKTVMEYSILTKNKAVGLRTYEKQPFSAECYPNPSKAENNIVLEASGNRVSIDLFDLYGRFIRTVYHGYVSEEHTTIRHDISDLPLSLYIYVINSPHGSATLKFIKN
jgi:hypothetical protein